MTWSEAREDCDAKGGKLVEINSEEENTALVEEIKSREYKRMNDLEVGNTECTDLEKSNK